MSTNNKISNLINSQVPFFVRNDHQTFVSFLEAYYEYLEQSNTTLQFGKTTERAKNFLNYIDIDKTLDDFAEKLYDRFLYLNINFKADKKLILKHVQDFYRAKGSEKSYRFLMRALFGEEMQFYYPKVDVLKASDGKWYIQRSLRVNDIRIANTSNLNITGLQKFTNLKVTGNNSGAFATVERVDRFSEQGLQIDELILFGIKGVFENGEKINGRFIDDFDNQTKSIEANVFGGIISSVTITNPGSRYRVGDHVIVTGDGAGACVVVGRVSTGNISSISAADGGTGYQNGNFLLITGGGGSGANAEIDAVNLDGIIHPTSYNIVSSLISLEAETPINNTVYSNLNNLITDPANNTLSDVLITFVYGNTGPARIIQINEPGSNYSTNPQISIIANNRIKELGILSRTSVISPGTGYSNNDYIIFENVTGGYGFGANANLIVNATGSILRTNWLPVQGQITGGSGYDKNFLPTANIQTSGGSGGSVNVDSILGEGGSFISSNTTIGGILRVDILSGGSDYTTANLDFTVNGDGTATGTAKTVVGVFTYPGRYLNDDGHLSSFNFLQDRDYYQNHAYVLRIKRSINDYRQIVKDFLHPAGMKLWGQYELESNYHDYEPNTITTSDSTEVIFKNGTYDSVNGNVTIRLLTDHNQSVDSNIYIEFTSGDVSDNTDNVGKISNGEFKVVNVINSNSFSIVHYSSQSNTSGNAYVGLVVT
jgi:hypothetical protein